MSDPTFFELLQPGMKQELGSHTFEADEIIAFAKKFDPQRFHLSEEEAKDSLFGHLCASGWHTASIWMRLQIDCSLEQLLHLTGYNGPAPVFGASPGIRNMKWHYPVYVGDTITYSAVISSKQKTPKRPGWGLLLSHSEGHNQNGKLVFSMDNAVTLRTD